MVGNKIILFRKELNMKIRIISNMYPSKKFPSYGVFVKNHITILEEGGHDVEKIVMHKKENKIKKLGAYLVFYLKIIYSNLFKKRELIYIHYASHTALPVIISLCFRPKLKVIVNLHGSDVYPEKKSQHIFQPLVKKLCQKAVKVVVPSQYFKESIKTKYDINDQKIYISPSGGVDLDIFHPHTKKAKDDICIGFVGRIDKDKGWENALRAFAKIREEFPSTHLKMTMIGSGEFDHLKLKLTKHLNIQDSVTFLPLIPQSDLPDYYNTFDVFLFPSRRQGESLGLVGLEAMACGVPVIGSDIAGIKSYVKDGKNGFLFPPGDEKSLVLCLRKFLELEKKQLAELKDYSCKTAALFDKKKVSKNFLAFIDSFYMDSIK